MDAAAAAAGAAVVMAAGTQEEVAGVVVADTAGYTVHAFVAGPGMGLNLGCVHYSGSSAGYIAEPIEREVRLVL